MVPVAEREVFIPSLAGINLRSHKTSLIKRKAASQLGCASLHCITWAEAEMIPGKMNLRCVLYRTSVPSMSPIWSQAALTFRQMQSAHFRIVVAFVFLSSITFPINNEYTPSFWVLSFKVTTQHLTNEWLKPSLFLMRE